MNKQVGFAIIGCGRVAGHHAQNIVNTPSAKLVAVCDLNEAKAKDYSERFNAPYFTNYHEMLEKLGNDIDIVNVITPSGMHGIHAVDIIEKYKKNVMIEKPLVMNLSDGDKLVQAAEKNNVRIFPVFQNRFNKAVQKVRETVEKKDIGKIVMGSVRLYWCRPQT